MLFRWTRRLLCALAALCAPVAAGAGEPLHFGVINQRSPHLTAAYWNPILDYVGERSGVPLDLRIGKSSSETTALAVRDELDFYVTNHLFTPERDALGWQVFARVASEGLRASIVVPEASPIRSLEQLAGHAVAFPSADAFAGYWLPMDELLRRAIDVTPVFAGTQEGAMARMAAGSTAAASVNARVAGEYAEREKLRYRVLWTSQTYPDLALMAHPRVDAARLARVREAFVGMADSPDGRRILETSARLVRQQAPLGFVAADNRDYDAVRRVYRLARVKPAADAPPAATAQ